MIADLSKSLRKLLTDAGASFGDDWSDLHIVFDRPTDSFNPAQPTLSLYLYDVRENMELRSSESFVDWKDGRAVITPPPVRVACTYLLTAWPGSGLQGDDLAFGEHHLLSQALRVFARHRSLPAEALVGSLVGQQPALPVISARAEGLPNPSEFWTSLNNKLRPSLTVTVTLSIPVQDDLQAPPVVSSEIVLKAGAARRSDPVRADFFDIGGRVLDASRTALADVAVSLKEQNLHTRSGADGRYVLGSLTAGRYTLVAESGGRRLERSVDVPGADARAYELILT